MFFNHHPRYTVGILCTIMLCLVYIFLFPRVLAGDKFPIAELPKIQQTTPSVRVVQPEILTLVPEVSTEIPVVHIPMPASVRAVYVSGWVAGNKTLRNKIIKLVDETEINAVVIDIKDSTGKVSFHTDNPEIIAIGSSENRISDIRELITHLHEKNIYVIGRISVFQDPYLTHLKPEWAIHRKSNGNIWKDRKGLSFLDPTNTDVWNYITTLAIESYRIGFDEINFDYIRFPSDGNISDITYPSGTLTRADHIENFFKHIDQVLRKEKSIPISADLFGMTTTANNDLGIGQVLERALPYFDAIAPMIYPSHYPKNFQGYTNPAAHPGSIISIAMKGGIAKAKVLEKPATVFRPWLQDFNMGATYGPTEIRAQIDALHELGIDSWMMWDPANTYTTGGYKTE
jgi:hypothetical protein